MKDAHGIRDEPSILVVDDYEDNRQMYAELLAYAGYQVAEARDGAEAIAMAHRILPDLIVMDLSLPVIDGWEATRRLKADERTRPIPVLALTGHAPEGLAGHSEAARDAGCDAFLAKPCSPETLLQAIQEMLVAPRRSARVDAKASPLLDAKASPLLDAKASPLLDAKASPILDAKASPILDAKASPILDAKASPILDAKASPLLDAKASPSKVRVRPRGTRRAG